MKSFYRTHNDDLRLQQLAGEIPRKLDLLCIFSHMNIVTFQNLYVLYISMLDIRLDKTAEGLKFRVIVFVQGLLVGSSSQFSGYSIAPLQDRLSIDPELELATSYLRSEGIQLSTNISGSTVFNDDPLSVIDFSCILGDSREQISDFTFRQTAYVLSAFSLTRGAMGKVFLLLSINLNTGKVDFMPQFEEYFGNLCIGGLSGGYGDESQKLIEIFSTDPYKYFLARLYSEAISERNIDFKYVRYWHILAIMSKRKNYSQADILTDFSGDAITGFNGKQKTMDSEVAPVYRLIKEHKQSRNIAESNSFASDRYSGVMQFSQWEMVNFWYAFRNAIIHHGSRADLALNSLKEDQKLHALSAKQKILEYGSDFILDDLKSTVDLMLRFGLLIEN